VYTRSEVKVNSTARHGWMVSFTGVPLSFVRSFREMISPQEAGRLR